MTMYVTRSRYTQPRENTSLSKPASWCVDIVRLPLRDLCDDLLRTTRGLGTLWGSFRSSERRLDELVVLEVGHGVVPQDAQDGLLSALIEIGCDGPMSLTEKDL